MWHQAAGTCAEVSDTCRFARPCSCFRPHLSTCSSEHGNQQAQRVASAAWDTGSANKVEVPMGRNHKWSCEGLLVKELLTYIKSNQRLYTNRCWSLNLNLVTWQKLDNSVPKYHRSKTSLADELTVITTKCIRQGSKVAEFCEILITHQTSIWKAGKH